MVRTLVNYAAKVFEHMLMFYHHDRCFQERLLSRRYLLFGREEVLWECTQEVACSCSSMFTGPFNNRPDDMYPAFPHCPATKAQLFEGDVNPSSIWQNLVTEYSTRLLTFPEDKLPALAGLASAIQVLHTTTFA